MNDKELKVLALVAEYEAVTIATIAERAWPDKPSAAANSWVRNSVRRAVELRLLVRPKRGELALGPATVPCADLGLRIALARRGLYSQQAIAFALGVKRGRVAHWEQNRSTPTFVQLVKIAQTTGADLVKLLHGDG